MRGRIFERCDAGIFVMIGFTWFEKQGFEVCDLVCKGFDGLFEFCVCRHLKLFNIQGKSLFKAKLNES